MRQRTFMRWTPVVRPSIVVCLLALVLLWSSGTEPTAWGAGRYGAAGAQGLPEPRLLRVHSTVTTLAGGGSPGYADGHGDEALFHDLVGVALDKQGNVFVADADNDRIRRIAPDGQVTTFAGSGEHGDDNGPSDQASFAYPSDLAIDGAGTLYVLEFGGRRIRSIASSGIVDTMLEIRGAEARPGAPAAPSIDTIDGIAVDATGTLYLAECENARIWRLTAAGGLSVFAGGIDVSRGHVDGPGPSARFDCPHRLAVDGAGAVYVAERVGARGYYSRIRKITPDGTVTTLTRERRPDGSIDRGLNTLLSVSEPELAVDPLGTVYVASPTTIFRLTAAGEIVRYAVVPGVRRVVAAPDGSLLVTKYDRVERVAPNRDLTSLAGAAPRGQRDGRLEQAGFGEVRGLAIGPSGALYAGDVESIRVVARDGEVTTLPPSDSRPVPRLSTLTVGRDGVLYAIESNFTNAVLRRSAEGNWERICGAVVVEDYVSGRENNGFQDGPCAEAKFDSPHGLAIAADGTIYVSDKGNSRVRRISPSGTVSTFAGDGLAAYSPTGLYDIAVGPSGEVFVVDDSGLLRITPDESVTRLGSPSCSAGDGPVDHAYLSGIWDIEVGPSGEVYLLHNGFIRRIGTDGAVMTVAGELDPDGEADGECPIGLDGYRDGPGETARFARARHMAVDADGVIYVADYGNNRIRRIVLER